MRAARAAILVLIYSLFEYKTRFQSSFMLITIPSLRFAKAINGLEKMPARCHSGLALPASAFLSLAEWCN
jgi:hypothetical protein